MPTSGIPMPACCARLRTVSSSQCSAGEAGASMTRTPMVLLAIHFDIASEISEPMKPKNAANTSRPLRLLPWRANQASRPVTYATIVSISTIARLVSTNKTMRFIDDEPIHSS